MSSIDINALPLAELKQLQRHLAKAIASFEDRRKFDARTALEAQAKELGYTLSELLDVTATRKRTPPVAKYRNPQNAEVTWSGRGRKPLWFIAAIHGGKKPSDLKI